MKQDMWELRKIQSQGITDNAQYPAGTYIVFTAAAPYIPLFEQHGKDDIALSLVRHEEAWWIVNHSDELCCAVNEQVMEPHHRMRLNDGDTIEWGLSSWCLARTNDESRPDVSFPQLVQSSESVAEYLDLDWFKQQQLNPQNPFDIIPVRETASSYTGHEADSTLHQLYQEYQQALRPSGQEKPLRDKPFPRNEDAVTQDLTSLYDKKGDTDTLQDMVAGAPGIDAILDTLDTTGEGEMHWLAMESMPDILQLLSPEQAGKTAHSEILPDLTRREHRIIGIDSHYRITPTQKMEILPMKKTDTLPATLSALLQEYSIAEGIQMAEQQVRENPAKALCRHSLFQLLCVAGDWSRALHQLQLCARMEANYTQEARLYRELVRCEMFRRTVFQGEQRPGFLLPQPVWVESLLAALACHDDTGEVDKHRNTALEAITDTGGQWNGGAFDWASDSDSRLGPVLELVTGGVYIWLPFSQIRSLESPQPARLTDLLWKPVNITLVNGDTHGAWLFTRYSGSESASDALRLCRETAWQDGPGETTVRVLGQKVWLTSHGDISLLDMAHCTFHAQENDGA
ncbi:type VI secretion system-associated protein TagK [Salmonella enterica]|nr:type VI secretion system-associated protein TagK [Salmonella enterica subsp. enterica]EAO9720682.1 type VI secretion system-associated protein TagK [Salmonella enterica]ECT8308360.1 type VI secretion system-associated protein TagK [Salmonella enterica subsp. enterica serovar Llandoff]EGZ4604795.1 type VI secretion system-associated protein TagK [Salmonella enterica subsp. enterica serovar Everleigh]EBI6346856.1 type VI secretion system-associated protein TagK [Salmonella enterica]